MPAKDDYYHISLLLTRKQEAALKKAVGSNELSLFIHQLLAHHIPDYPMDDIPRRGKYYRQTSHAERLSQKYSVTVERGSFGGGKVGFYLLHDGHQSLTERLGSNWMRAEKRLREILNQAG
jgi:hypothetical protein